ncbi:rhodanese-like domain-containing protein [Parasalinivibrio latis]|uniref:rhodanese-like domain-containing protein n=1 Tax=Parasalinivibrio latis TaxID=2952610 RepID=UPI0030DF6919
MQQFIQFVSNNMIMSLVWVGLLVALISMIVKQKTSGFNIAGPSDATLLVNNEDGVFVDIRSRDEFRAGHIAGSVHILPADIKKGSFGDLEKRKANPIIVVCKTGQTAQTAASDLVKAGFEKVYLLKDGMISWNEGNLPLVRGKK